MATDAYSSHGADDQSTCTYTEFCCACRTPLHLYSMSQAARRESWLNLRIASSVF